MDSLLCFYKLLEEALDSLSELLLLLELLPELLVDGARLFFLREDFCRFLGLARFPGSLFSLLGRRVFFDRLHCVQIDSGFFWA